MQEPVLPGNEAARVATLRSLNILDTPRDARYDRYTRSSVRIFDTPIAVISLVDRYRQWFKSAAGLDATETPRSVSFCGHAILGDDIFEVSNARRDARFHDNPLVVNEPHIRFYAGAPLETPTGFKLGTLCILDRVPRRLSNEEKIMLKSLADMVVNEIVGDLDDETGLANRGALLDAGATCFTNLARDKDYALHLFEINDAVGQQAVTDPYLPAGMIFASLLPSFYPDAHSIAYLGSNRFCVLLERSDAFDARRAINHLCAVTKNALCAGSGVEGFSAFVGIVQLDRENHHSFDDVMADVDAMFERHESQPAPGTVKVHRFREALARFRAAVR